MPHLGVKKDFRREIYDKGTTKLKTGERGLQGIRGKKKKISISCFLRFR